MGESAKGGGAAEGGGGARNGVGDGASQPDAENRWLWRFPARRLEAEAVRDALLAVAGELDHGLLNEKPGLETPSLEHICLYFAGQLKPRFPGLCRIVVSRPTISESCALEVPA